MIIQFALYLLLIAIIVFIGMAGFYRIGWLVLSNILLWIGTETLLFGGAILIILGCCALLMGIFRQLRGYFSKSAQEYRALWHAQLKQVQSQAVFDAKAQQFRFFTENKRRRLLAANNAKHSQQLAKCIQDDLYGIRQKIPKLVYQQLLRQLKYDIRQQDMDNLLKLHQHIKTLVDNHA